MNEIITLQQLLDMLNALPESIRNKRIGYMDLAHLDKEALENLKRQLEKDTENGWIEVAEN